MKCLIYGSKGWIGTQFLKVIPSSIEVVCGNARCDDASQVRQEIDTVQPTHVYCFLGRTHGTIEGRVYSTIDYLEQPGKLRENLRDNFKAPLNLAEMCQNRNIHLTYLGTGCIFAYDQNHPEGNQTTGFLETDHANFFGSSYSIVKGYTDRLIQRYKNVLNLRIRMPITDEYNPRNFLTKITTYDKICSLPNSMTVLPELLPKVFELSQRNYTGTLNLTNPGCITHNEILTMYRDLVDPNFTWTNFTEQDQNKLLDSKRSNNCLDTTKLTELFPDIQDIHTSVRQMLTTYKPQTIIRDRLDSPNTVLLVTGGCGFIGSHFINTVLSRYSQLHVVNVDAMYYCADKMNIEPQWRQSPRYTMIQGNTRSKELIEHIFSSYQPTHVINFAAQSHVQSSFNDSLNYTEDNIVGTHTLLEVAKKYNKLKLFVHVSTDEVYGESSLDIDESSKTEQTVLCPTNPYAATKVGAEALCQSYSHSFKLPIIITRGNNVYGPRQYPEKVIPKFINLLSNKQPVTIQGDGSSVRAFMHVQDTVEAFLTILNRGRIGEIYNIGCDEGMEYSVVDVAHKIMKFMNFQNPESWIRFVQDRPFNDQRYYISNQKLKDLGWKIQIPFDQGLQSLIDECYKLNI
tara:strand:- start:2456 stop:4336 length:1881 start_codon:yes stop_codon:yes gene_type:complete